jgi:hypothetical protein
MSSVHRVAQRALVGACVLGIAAGASAQEPGSPTPAAPAGAEPTVPSLELGGIIGPSIVFGDAANEEYNPSLTRVGVFGAVSLAYRSSYFIDPFLMLGYASLASGEATLPAGVWGDGGTLKQHLGAWVFAPGITIDIWRFRPRIGIGFAVVEQSNSFRGFDNSSTQVAIANQFALGFNALDSGRFRLDAEARLVQVAGADITFVTLDVVARGDVVMFGSD